MDFESYFIIAIIALLVIPAVFQEIVLDNKPIKLKHYPKMVVYSNICFALVAVAFTFGVAVCGLLIVCINHLAFDGPSVELIAKTLFWQL
ncbi:MAG: hypothetical protein Unbinned6354contig1000_29 [Prokaryotic dsDNA virus sp.]|nr:hypothetical protein [Cytophagaceae bacterium]QDP54326.1 MAG: hypothetical protein Unbinned6354contig1000_29 [Prokaryotic dsDNA virus sp.]|tara:strand:+ start:1884 stop:2153 length:270 start_codon:yes stop_codon:yes gene_type:complete